MARIAGTDVPNEKRILISLTYIHGVGRTTSRNILGKVNIDINKRTGDLSDTEIAQIQGMINEMQIPVEGELRRIASSNIRRLQEIRSYRGLRHREGLPVRGQRTSHNARTRKGRKKTVGGLKRKLAKK